MKFTEWLLEYSDEENADFQAKLTPTIKREDTLGVRVSNIRKLVKACIKDEECDEFLKSLPHRYYDENMLHAAIISEEKDCEEMVRKVDAFLPYVDNWAVCDTLLPKCFKKNKALLMEEIKRWTSSSECYTCRFGLRMLMNYFLDEDFKPEYHEIAAVIRSDEYYINMMIAWYFATALAKQWDGTVKYIEENRLDPWTHNKAIQKSCESYRVSDEHKAYLKSLKRKVR